MKKLIQKSLGKKRVAHLHDHPHDHNHETCMQQAMSKADDVAKDHKVRLTPIRRHVLEILWQSHKPQGAYAILSQLSPKGKKIAPLTVYRALDFLEKAGFIHRLESLNAYIGCTHSGEKHAALFFVCDNCQNVTELDAEKAVQYLHGAARQKGLYPTKTMIEIKGLCGVCRGKGAA
jgi:Fur family transcriptional regulator, zinc uptake regulator